MPNPVFSGNATALCNETKFVVDTFTKWSVCMCMCVYACIGLCIYKRNQVFTVFSNRTSTTYLLPLIATNKNIL